MKKSQLNCCFPALNQLPDEDIYTSKNAESKFSELLSSLWAAEYSDPFLPSSGQRVYCIPLFTTNFSGMADAVFTLKHRMDRGAENNC